MPLTLKIKQVTGQDTFPVEAQAEDTVAALKQAVAAKVDAEPAAIRLIYRGQILKDASTLESYGGRHGGWRRVAAGRRGSRQQGRLRAALRHPGRMITCTPACVQGCVAHSRCLLLPALSMRWQAQACRTST